MEDLSDNVLRCAVFGNLDGVEEILTKVHEKKATISADALKTGKEYLISNGRNVPGEAPRAPTVEDVSNALMRCVIFGNADAVTELLNQISAKTATADDGSIETAKTYLRSNGHTVPGEAAAKVDPNNLPNIDDNIARCTVLGSMEGLQNCIMEILNGVAKCSPERLEMAKTVLKNNGVEIPTSGSGSAAGGHAADEATHAQNLASAKKSLVSAERDLKNHESSLAAAVKTKSKSSIDTYTKNIEHDKKKIKDLQTKIARLEK